MPADNSSNGHETFESPDADGSPLQRLQRRVTEWERTWGAYDAHPALHVPRERLHRALDAYAERLTGNYPFGHPRYAGQMLKPPHPIALAAYAAAMRINPNNHALDGGPPTSAMEKEVVADLADMLGLPSSFLGHLTSGGTVANLEALWVARESHPDKGIAFSTDAHYTHGRMCGVLQVDTHLVPTDRAGRMDLDALEEVLRSGSVGTVVLTTGTTGLGTVDRVEDAVPLCREYGARVHIDAAYGGFFTLMAHESAPPLDGFPAASFKAIGACDSVAIDPHKHGLQPYGCGCILFRDPAVGRYYKHDSPYTYFTSDELHLGEISLECSRAGAAAGALWCTLQALPLQPDDGLGPVVAAGLRAARLWADKLQHSDVLRLLMPPETDIVTYLPMTATPTLSAVHEASQRVFEAAMNDPDDPIFVSVYRLSANKLCAWCPDLEPDRDDAAVLRSVLMKPEHETYVDVLHARLEAITRRLRADSPA